jgi:hypothetical protein
LESPEKKMQMTKWGYLSVGLALALSPCAAHAAQQVSIGKVNTSVGVKPTSAKNKFILETDPAFSPGAVVPGGTPADYIPTEGLLNNFFDPTQFQLATDPSTGTFALGASVAGEGAYQVVGFEVQTVDGGLVDVQDNGQGGENVTNDTSSPLDPSGGPVGGGETGNVYDIHFKIISQDRALAQPSSVDQNFYELFLIGNNPTINDETTFVTPDSYITFSPIDPTDSDLSSFTVDAPNIAPSVVPEVSTAGFLAVGGASLFLRRRKAKTQSQAQAPSASSTPPDQA